MLWSVVANAISLNVATGTIGALGSSGIKLEEGSCTLRRSTPYQCAAFKSPAKALAVHDQGSVPLQCLLSHVPRRRREASGAPDMNSLESGQVSTTTGFSVLVVDWASAGWERLFDVVKTLD